jgi:hypothetical protein
VISGPLMRLLGRGERRLHEILNLLAHGLCGQ